MDFKVMTFNIQHCALYKKGRIGFRPFAEAILSSGAGIIGLNEVRNKGERADYEAQPKILSSLTGFTHYFAKAIDVDGNNPYGNALLTKYPLISAETVRIPDPEVKIGEFFESRCILSALIDVGTPVNIFITHMGLNHSERVNAVRTLTEIMPDRKAILMGDFNCTPDDKVLSPLFKRFRCTDTEDLTFPSDAPEEKIDYIFYTPDISLKAHRTHKNIISDHLAQEAEFSITE